MAGTTVAPERSLLSRPTAETGWASWLTTVDHKKVGILYFLTSLVFFAVGGLEAGLIRLQLSSAEAGVVSAEVYNQLFSMHGITMILLVLIPMAAGFFNYLVPLQIGARDVAFPRLNAFSYWTFLVGGVFLYSAFLAPVFGNPASGAPNGGWFGYAPLSTNMPGTNMAFYAVGLQILGVGTLASSVNFITTILNMRAPGLTFMRMPVFTWMSLVTNFLLLFAMPVIAVALFMLTFDTTFGTQFFQAATGGDPILWQHLFWLFGHPEVYIIIMPAFGVISEVLPTFSRKPLFGYAAVVFAGAVIGFIGWGVWAHHMFTAGLGPVANAAFALSSMVIAVPTGIKIFNWVFTLWGGKLKFTTSMLFGIGFIAMFVIGGLSGVMHTIVPHNAQQHDTYFVVSHFHYVMAMGALFGLIAGIYYWFPKVTGRLLDERLGRWHFWTWFAGSNLAFGPMFLSGLFGQPRRTAVLPEELGGTVLTLNQLSTAGYIILFVSALIFLYNFVASLRHGQRAGHDPWDARTLEWITPNPPPSYNFATIPTVTHRDELWHRKYTEDERGVAVPIPAGGAADEPVHDRPADADEHIGVQDRAVGDGTPGDQGHDFHMPDPSYWPLVMVLGVLPLAYGIVLKFVPLAVLGVLWMLVGMYGWIIEPVAESDEQVART